MRLSREKKNGIGLAAAGIILLLVALLLFRDGRNFLEASKWVSHSREVLAELEATLSAVGETQAAARGYIITDQAALLEPYRAARPGVRVHLDRLRSLTSDNPNQQRRLLLLESAIAEKLESLQENIDLRKQKGFAAAQQQLTNGGGSAEMDQVRTIVSQMKQAEEERLKLRDRQFQASTQRTGLTLACVVFVGFLLLGLVYFVLLRDIMQRGRAEALLQESEERHRKLFDNNPHPTWVFDRETLRFLAVNSAAVSQYGYSSSEFLTMTIKDIHMPENSRVLIRETPAQTWAETLQSGTASSEKREPSLMWKITSYALERFEDRDAGSRGGRRCHAEETKRRGKTQIQRQN